MEQKCNNSVVPWLDQPSKTSDMVRSLLNAVFLRGGNVTRDFGLIEISLIPYRHTTSLKTSWSAQSNIWWDFELSNESLKKKSWEICNGPLNQKYSALNLLFWCLCMHYSFGGSSMGKFLMTLLDKISLPTKRVWCSMHAGPCLKAHLVHAAGWCHKILTKLSKGVLFCFSLLWPNI